MKNRLHDAPVKIIQILPVDNKDTSKQPLKPADFSFFKRMTQACREAAGWVLRGGSPIAEERQPERESHQAGTAVNEPAPLLESPNSAVRPSDVQQPEMPHSMVDLSAPACRTNIVVRDLALLPEIDREPTEPSEPINNPHFSLTDLRHRLESTKTAIAGQWRREKEQIAAVKVLTIQRLVSSTEAARLSLSVARLRLSRSGTTMPRLLTGKISQMTKTTRRNKRKAGQEAGQELSHEIEVTKATLLAQQQALENVTVQLNAVQKELARHKSMLAGLMTQVEAIDLKIVQTIQTPAYRKPRLNADPGHPRRPLGKKHGLSVERSREQGA